MYQFTTETIINSMKDENGVNKWVTYTDNTVSPAETAIKIRNVGNFIPSQIINKTYHPYSAPVLEVGVIDFADFGVTTDAAKVYRLDLTIKLDDSALPDYANDSAKRFLRLSYESFGVATTALTIANMVKSSEVIARQLGNPQITLVGTGSTITVTATNEYQRIVEAKLYSTVSDPLFPAIADTLEIDFFDTATPIAITPGKPGFGTVRHIMTNLRLPTTVNTHWLAPNQEERPIPGGCYTQYSVIIKVPRSITGMGAVGQYMESVTTHVFYVEDGAKTDFETAAFGAVGITFDEYPV